MKGDIYKFSIQTVVDISNLAVVLDETGRGQMLRKAWEDLQTTRWAIQVGKPCGPTQICLTNRIQRPGQRNL